jgi:uncharacterized protein (TIGR00255 family)
MTGFSKVEVENGEGKCYGEARSLNSRYLEISLKLPRSASSLESKLREMTKKVMKRGRLDVTIKWDRGDENLAIPTANDDAIRSYIALADHLKQTYDLTGSLTLNELMSFKDILVYEEKLLPEQMLLDCFELLLQKLNEEREREGALVKADLLGRLDTIGENLALVERRWPEAIKNHENLLKERILEISHAVVDETKILQEMGFYMERLDIAEEISRLGGHVQHFRDTLESGEEIGRKLDFIIQEMVRETNTIASKSNDLFISERAILIKVEIEKMREQVQNVE